MSSEPADLFPASSLHTSAHVRLQEGILRSAESPPPPDRVRSANAGCSSVFIYRGGQRSAALCGRGEHGRALEEGAAAILRDGNAAGCAVEGETFLLTTNRCQDDPEKPERVELIEASGQRFFLTAGEKKSPAQTDFCKTQNLS